MNSEVLNLGVFQFKSAGAGYAFANTAQEFNAEILELSFLGSGSLLILNFRENEFQKFSDAFKNNHKSNELAFSALFANFPVSHFEKYLGLSNVSAGADLHIFESSFVGDLFEISTGLADGQIIEIRLLRGSQTRAILVASQVPKNFNKSAHIQHTEILRASQALKDFFDVTPKS